MEDSIKEEELREYGMLITTTALYISLQNITVDNKNDIEIPFSGIWKVYHNKNESVIIFYDADDFFKIDLNLISRYIDEDSLVNLLNFVVNTNISLSLLQDNLILLSEEFQHSAIDECDKKNSIEQNTINTSKALESAGLGVNVLENNKAFNEFKSNMNGARGAGYGAEYGNNTIDKLMGHKVENLGAQLDETGKQVKYGADKSVDGVNIQVKYYKTSSESIGAAFRKKQAVYLNEDGSMMVIEVPKDQYFDALNDMQKKN